jgi:hypothetical protein
MPWGGGNASSTFPDGTATPAINHPHLDGNWIERSLDSHRRAITKKKRMTLTPIYPFKPLLTPV